MSLNILSLFVLFFSLQDPVMAVVTKPVTQAWVRTDGGVQEMKISPKGRYIAFKSLPEKHLKVLDIKTKNIYLVTKNFVGSSYFWAPGDFRLFYKEMGAVSSKKIISKIQAYDCMKKKSILVEEFPYETGTLTFDARDNKMYILHKNGIHAQTLLYPNNRLARWQKIKKLNSGKWILSPKGVLWISRGGLRMRNMSPEGQEIDSFDLSPDGKSVVWATKKGEVFVNNSGKRTIKVGFGRNPAWHPTKNILIYSGARKVGNSVTGYDLKIYDRFGRHKWVTQTPHSNESWPQWTPDGEKIVYTKDKSTDLYTMVFLR